MDTRFLETFLAVADCGSIAEAARRLNLTPAALAQRLRVLEQDLGHTLVERAGRTVQPTAAGRAVMAHARGVVESVRDLRAIASDGVPGGLLRLGATATALTGLLPAVIERLARAHPDIDYFVQPGSSADHYHRVVDGTLDAALIVRPQFEIPKATDWLTLRVERLVLIVPEDAPDLPPDALLATYRFIRYDRAQWGGHIVDRYLRDHAIAVDEWLELDALDAIAALVNRGLGAAIVPDWAPPWPEGLRLRKIALPDGGARETGVIWQRWGPRHAAIDAFVAACRAAHPVPG
ncbi:LysR family transcriptional regulator [Frigidibacter sp. MR17.14]|uniref:LysR family transcriptional regulator n=1 Tax=Frigidibacter sp. MR17.14 TaxID=3126509 RepID=UPI003012F537